MSIELSIKIWDRNSSKIQSVFLDLLTVIHNNIPEIVEPKNLTVRNSHLHKQVLKIEKPFSIEQISDALIGFEREDLHFSLQWAMPCWRFERMEIIKAFLPFWIEVWSPSFLKRTGRRLEVEGNASITFSSVGPFTALIENESNTKVKQVNSFVEANLELVTEIIFAIIKKIQPKSIKSFTALGLYQPLNAHLIFFKDSIVLQEDLDFIKELWYYGLPEYKTPPLRNSLHELDTYALSSLRTEQQAKEILQRLAPVIDCSGDLIGIDWSKYDFFDSEFGKIILEYPYWVNGFVDSFYIDILDQLAIRT